MDRKLQRFAAQMLLFLSPTGSVVTTAPTRTLFERLKSPNLVAELDAQRTPVVRLPDFLSADEQARLHEVAREVQREGVDHHSTKAIGGGKAWRTTFVNQRLPELLPVPQLDLDHDLGDLPLSSDAWAERLGVRATEVSPPTPDASAPLSSDPQSDFLSVSDLPSFYLHDDDPYNFSDSVACLLNATGLRGDVDAFDEQLIPDMGEHMVVLVHGFAGSLQDLRLVRAHLRRVLFSRRSPRAFPRRRTFSPVAAPLSTLPSLSTLDRDAFQRTTPSDISFAFELCPDPRSSGSSRPTRTRT